jgi:sugar phosphate isomerase/epimerase
MDRRTFLALAAAGLARATVRGMQLHLSCGALGIKATRREAVDLAAQYRFDVIDADGNYLGGLADGALHDLLGYMEAKKVGWAMAGLPVEFRRDDDTFAAGIAKLPAFAQGLQRAGVTKVTTWVSPGSNERPYLVNFKLHAARLGEAAHILHDSGVRLGLEYVAPRTSWVNQRYPFIHTMAEMRELLAAINVPGAGLVIDSWHWYHAGDSAKDIEALSARDIVSVDLNDAPAGIPKDQMVDGKRELPAATGVIDVKAFLGALERIKFNGPVRAEPFNEAVRRMAPDEAAAAAMTALKKAAEEV